MAEETDFTVFEHILVPLDGSALAESVLPHVVGMARALEADVTLLRAVERVAEEEESETVDPLGWHMRKSEAEAYLDEVAIHLRETDVQVEVVMREGKAAQRIIEFAHSEDVDLIILSSHGRSGLSKWNINSVVQKVILRAYMPSLIIRAYQSVPEELTGLRYKRIMIPLDGSQRAECVLPLAEKLAQTHECPLLLAHVVSKPEVMHRTPPPQEEQELIERLIEIKREQGQDYLDEVKAQLSVEAEPHLRVSANAPAVLHDLVDEENVDLVVLSAHGQSGEAKWPYGSVALNFIAYGSTPLLIVQDLSQEEIQRTKAEQIVQEEEGH
jgi:nucleotide-binding universal stress UspA family protein